MHLTLAKGMGVCYKRAEFQRKAVFFVQLGIEIRWRIATSLQVIAGNDVAI